MKRGRDGKRRKSKIQNPTPEHTITLEAGLMAGMATCGLHDCKIKVFYRGRIGDSGLPIVVGVIDARDYCENIYSERNFSMESYIHEEFGSGIFEAALYDENNTELGRYRYRIGGAAYIHYSKASDDEDSESKDPAVELFMMLFRERFLEDDDYFLEEDDY